MRSQKIYENRQILRRVYVRKRDRLLNKTRQKQNMSEREAYMKKLLSIILSFIAVLMIHYSSEAADIQKADLNIDGICMDQNLSEVFAKYGKPDRIEHGIPVGRICIYNINGGELRVSATSAEESGTVEGVTIIGNTGLATKAGIKVGSNAEDVIKAYGGKIITFSPEPKMKEATQMILHSLVLEHDIIYNPSYGFINYGKKYYSLWFYLNDDNKVIRISFWRKWSSE